MLQSHGAPSAWLVYLRLGRVSNLPTVWSNCLAGALITLGAAPPQILLLMAAMSLFYTGGMFLNDAFDADYDRAARPERPIPLGWVNRRRVMAVGFLLIAAGEVLLGVAAEQDARLLALVVGAALAALIVYYDWRHKRDPYSAIVMAACRALVYVAAGAAVTLSPPPALFAAAVILAAYVVALSQVAKRELLPGRRIAILIAGISLVDAALIVVLTGNLPAALAAAVGFLLTLMAQRLAPGT